MRDLKFRALFKHLKSKETIWLETMPNHALKDMDRYVQLTPWMQFTGLTDKNGKEIYEGDIVETNGSMNFSSFDSGKGAKREIFVLNSGFIGVRLGNEFDKKHPSSAHIWSNYQLWNISKSLEVIGNIYETPYLL